MRVGYLGRRVYRLRRELGLWHVSTRSDPPQTKGKMERLVKTTRASLAYGAAYRSSLLKGVASPEPLRYCSTEWGVPRS